MAEASALPRAPFLFLVACATASLWVGCTTRPAREREPAVPVSSERVPYPDGTPASACKACHLEIVEEWRQSPHAAAFTREEFRAASQNHGESDCLRCHIPTSLEKLSAGPVRAKFREEGVNCDSCHLQGHAYAAPVEPTTFALHDVVQNGLLRKSELCGRCHESIFRQWSAASVAPNERKTCQHCHMSPARRRTVSGTGWRVLHMKLDGRRHEFTVLPAEPGRSHLDVTVGLAEVSANVVAGSVTLTNTGAQHAIPGGEFGFREIAVIASLVDRYGIASAKKVHQLVNRRGRDLAYGQTRALPFRFESVPDDAEALEVRVVRGSFRGQEGVVHTDTRPLRPAP